MKIDRREDRRDMIHQTLWHDCSLLVQSCVEHPFVQQLAEGILPETAYQRHLEQEPFLWHAWFRAFALAAAKARKLRHARKLHELMGDAIAELRERRHAAGSASDDEAALPRSATRAYVDFVLRTAWSNEPGEILAAVAPCLSLEAHLGRKLAETAGREHPFTAWIRLRADRRTKERAERVESLLDALVRLGRFAVAASVRKKSYASIAAPGAA
jgi:thiaminase/transcriptional activator TenA